MKLHRLHYRQNLPISLDAAWAFLSDPRNLERITPPWLRFRMTSEAPEAMYPGLILTHTVQPILRVPIQWVTEITHVREPHYFVDEQRFGPYRFWHHQHHLREIEGGVEMEDLIHYALPFGPAGSIANRWMVSGQLREVFEYRKEVLEKEFGRFK